MITGEKRAKDSIFSVCGPQRRSDPRVSSVGCGGASAVYSMADLETWQEGRLQAVRQILEGMRKLGVQVGIGEHKLETISLCRA
jgi:hypothetical protein